MGGRAAIPDLPGIHQVKYLTNTSLLQLDVLPRHLVIVGGSYVGIEFGQMFPALGVMSRLSRRSLVWCRMKMRTFPRQ
jgi:pyruvate/2-oxoglutarate dehydrogenase complex dihydrolipoamide dehydrogenase (E3) component